jgi:hypothetical protein
VWRRLKRSFMSYNPPQIFFGWSNEEE